MPGARIMRVFGSYRATPSVVLAPSVLSGCLALRPAPRMPVWGRYASALWRRDVGGP